VRSSSSSSRPAPDPNYYDYSDGTSSASDHDDWGYLDENILRLSSETVDQLYVSG
jgi:hypothetical protein